MVSIIPLTLSFLTAAVKADLPCLLKSLTALSTVFKTCCFSFIKEFFASLTFAVTLSTALFAVARNVLS